MRDRGGGVVLVRSALLLLSMISLIAGPPTIVAVAGFTGYKGLNNDRNAVPRMIRAVIMALIASSVVTALSLLALVLLSVS